jgi:hypothetical protein
VIQKGSGIQKERKVRKGKKGHGRTKEKKVKD